MSKTPATIRRAFDRAESICNEHAKFPLGDINLSSIASRLIQECGRWTERYASDFLITWKHVDDLCNRNNPLENPNENFDEIFLFAIRRDGVDHTSFFMSRIMEGVNEWRPYLNLTTYRKVFGVRVERTADGYCNVDLRDLTNEFTTLMDEDKDWNKRGIDF